MTTRIVPVVKSFPAGELESAVDLKTVSDAFAFLLKKPLMIAYTGTAYAVATGAITTVTLDSVSETSGDFTLSGNQITVNCDGIYRALGTALWDFNGAGDRFLNLIHNATQVGHRAAPSPGWAPWSVSTEVAAFAGDTFWMQQLQTSGANRTIQNGLQTSLMVEWVGAL